MARFDLENQASGTIATPSSGLTTVFIDTADKKLKTKDDAGTVTDYSAPGSAITALTGDVTATGPGSVVASIAATTVTGKVLTGFSASAGDVAATDTILQAFNKLASRLNCGWFGNGADADITYSINTTLVRDVYANNIVINSGVIITTAGFRMFALNNFQNNGTIERNGNAASGITAGAALAAGTLGASGAGGAGGTAAGSAGGASATALGVTGGSGGAGSGGAGGAAGTVTVPAATVGGVEVVQSARYGTIAQTTAGTVMTGGSGGGGGGGDGTAGGGGGGGAGIIVLHGRRIFGTGNIQAIGGNGGTPAGGNRGGGGGGGGGAIILISENDTTSESLVLSVAGGAGSSGTGTGVVGNNGTTGRIVRVRV